MNLKNVMAALLVATASMMAVPMATADDPSTVLCPTSTTSLSKDTARTGDTVSGTGTMAYVLDQASGASDKIRVKADVLADADDLAFSVLRPLGVSGLCVIEFAGIVNDPSTSANEQERIHQFEQNAAYYIEVHRLGGNDPLGFDIEWQD